MSDWTIYASLIALTAGTVVYLFLTVLILANHLRRRMDWLLFLVALAAFLIYSGRLLLLNAYLQYGGVPANLRLIVSAMVNISVFVLLPVCFHLQAETLAHTRDKPLSKWLTAAVVLAYFCAMVLATMGSVDRILVQRNLQLLLQMGLLWSTTQLVLYLGMALAFLVGALVLQWKLLRASQSPLASRFHKWMFVFLAGLALLLAVQWVYEFRSARAAPEPLRLAFLYWYLLPGAVAASFVLHHDLPRFPAKRNVLLTVAGGFLAVLYLTLTQRIAGWLEPWFPPVATTSVLVFVLVFLFEPIQRRVSLSLQRMMHGEVAKLQRLTAEIQNEARGGELGRLVSFAEERIRAEFSLASARLSLREGPARPAGASSKVERFVLHRPAAGAGPGEAEEIGVLEAYYYGAMLSGETHAALETLARQLPAAIDLCRLIEEKLTLERELAERERMALLGQMAASISHNLKNPLGSMKTLLQVQLENPALPENLRKDCSMVVAEIDRLSAKLTQLLHYARPALRTGAASESGVDAAALAGQIVELLQRDAQRRNITVTLTHPSGPLLVRGAQEAVSDILQNLIVNAVEAVPSGGTARIALERSGHDVLFSVTDDGAGIPADLRAKIFQPFFTTKPAGTGLGLAIVQRRLAELGGSITFDSPALNGRGTRFVVTLPREM